MTTRAHSSQTGHERRKHPRVSERVPLAISADGTEWQVEARNISNAGAYCTLERFIAPMTKLQLTCELRNGSQSTQIRCTGVVVRVEPVVATAQRGAYHIAIFFTEMSDRDRTALTRFIQQRLSSSPPTL